MIHVSAAAAYPDSPSLDFQTKYYVKLWHCMYILMCNTDCVWYILYYRISYLNWTVWYTETFDIVLCILPELTQTRELTEWWRQITKVQVLNLLGILKVASSMYGTLKLAPNLQTNRMVTANYWSSDVQPPRCMVNLRYFKVFILPELSLNPRTNRMVPANYQSSGVESRRYLKVTSSVWF